MTVRKAKIADIDSLMPIFEEARKTIAALGIDQWQNGYPSRDVILKDINDGNSYLVECDGKTVASFALIRDGEPTYDKIYHGDWETGEDCRNYFALHRVAISVSMRGRGTSSEIIGFAVREAREASVDSLRIDTHRGNVVMRRMLQKHGFEYCGIIYLLSGDERVAYEKVI